MMRFFEQKVIPMDQKVVHKLEKKIEEAIAEVIIVHMGLKRLPYLPPQAIMEMIAKAAVAVYEAVVEDRKRCP
jgi:hypothetical protein